MAKRVYQYDPEELAQFQRLEQRGFVKDDQTANRDDPQLRFEHEQLRFDFTFLPEGIAFEGDDEASFWEVKAYRISLSGCKVCAANQWLTMAEFNSLIDPERWVEMTAALQRLENLSQWREVMQPLLTPEAVAEPQRKLTTFDERRRALTEPILRAFEAYGPNTTVGLSDLAEFCEQPEGAVYMDLIDLRSQGVIDIDKTVQGEGAESITVIHASLTEMGKEQVNDAMDQSEQEDEALIQRAIAHDLGAMRSRFPGKVTVTHYEALIDRLREG